jgi:predicted nucleic acid-binding protein
VTERWVLNASPVIALSRVDYVHLLLDLPDAAVLPAAVAAEIEAGPASDAARQAVEAGRFEIVDVPLRPEIQAWDLGRGETSVLSWALSEPGWTAILDDLAARKCASSFALGLKGTLAVVILAKRRGLVPSAAKVLRALQAAGLRLDGEIIRVALERGAGETWEEG